MELDKNDVKALIGILQKLVVENEEQIHDESVDAKIEKPKTKNSKNKSHTKTLKEKRGRSYEEHQNKFLEMPEMNMHKSDTTIDKKLAQYAPTPRNRSVSLIKVKCRVCGKEDTINAKILPESRDRYKCNKCSTSSG
jgi:hypothetical protein